MLNQRLDRIELTQQETLKRIADGDVKFARLEQTLSGYNWFVAAVGVAVIGGIITFLGSVGWWLINAMGSKGV